jgi:hypothetical protein
MATTVAAKPRVGVVKLASCDGCQLTILDLEDELLALTDHFEIVDFPEASSTRSAGPYDVLFVEGSIGEASQIERLVELRRRSRFLVTIGACATAGGIQALRNWGGHDAFRDSIYARPELIHTLERSTPIADHVAVDAELRGCPIDPGQLVELLTALTTGRRPQLRDEAVCMECKRRGVVCVMVSAGTPCLGQVTQTGCGAICPRFGRGCYGCFGPREGANAAGLARHLRVLGDTTDEAIGRRFAGFTAWSEPFRTMVTEHGGVPAARTPAAAPAVPPGGGPAGKGAA